MTTILATYSAEDNKLRLYASERLDAETYARVKDAGFQWAPKQELFVAPKWTPAREDLCMELAGDIEPEEMTLAERAEIKAARLDGYAENRARDANAFQRVASELSRAFEGGQPILVGHHSERKARKTQERMHSAMSNSVKATKAVSYWQYRAAGVEHHANRKNDPRVRARRIKTLLVELRDHQRDLNHAAICLKLWTKAETEEQIAKLVNVSHIATGPLVRWEASSDLRAGKTTLQEERSRAINNANAILNSEYRRRWIDHILNRLGFEREELGAVELFTGELTPVILQAFAREHGAFKPKATKQEDGGFKLESLAPLPLHIGEGYELELSADEWCRLMQSCGHSVEAAKPRRTSNKPAPMPLINPTRKEAEQLQRIWNTYATAPEKNVVKEMAQKVFSANSKGDYAPCKTIDIDANGTQVRSVWRGHKLVNSGEPVARVRILVNGSVMNKANGVIHLTDKPTKPLPVDLDAAEQVAIAAMEARKATA